MAERTTGKAKHDHSAALLALHQLRASPEYRAAELIRRGTTAKAMVKKKTSKEYAAAILLIATWNTIGAAVRQVVESSSATGDAFLDSYLDAIFENVPVCHMYQGLNAALDQIADDWGEDFAPDFQWLYNEYLKWLERNGKDEKYRARHCKGIRAMFG